MFKRVLVVCSGNICRSPLAQVLLSRLLPNIAIDSAGVLVDHHDLSAHPAVNNSRIVAKENGLDLSNHKAKQLTSELIDDCDLILVMTHEHLEQVAQIARGARAKALLLGQWIGVGEIEDPIGKDIDVFRHSYELLEKACLSWSKRLNR
jgi:protein-tyrosine phosphatase